MGVVINIRANPSEVTIPIVPIVKVTPNFILQVRKDVINLPRAEKKRLSRELIATLTGLMSVCITNRAFAATPQVEVSPDVGALFMWMATAGVMIMVFMAIVALMAAGVMRMFNQEQYAQNWTQNIMKGLGQGILAAPIVLTMVFICHLLFNKSPVFVDPWDAISTFFGK